MAERKGIFKIVTDAEERPGCGVTALPGTRWQVFKALIGARFGSLVKINLWMLLFALPAVMVYFFNVSGSSLTLGALPFSSNGGVGYPYFDDVISIGNRAVFENSVIFICLMIPALIVAAIGLAGGFHAVGMLFGGENIPVTKTFFRGVKRNAWQYALIAAPASLSAALMMFYLSYRPVSGIKPFWDILLVILIILLLILTLIFAVYLFTQTESYKIKFAPLVKNSFAFAAGKILQNLIFLVLSLLPLSTILFLGGNTFMTFIILFILGLFAFSYFALIWAVHTRHIYGGFFGAAVQPEEVIREAAAPAAAPAAVRKPAGNTAHNKRRKKKQGKKH